MKRFASILVVMILCVCMLSSCLDDLTFDVETSDRNSEQSEDTGGSTEVNTPKSWQKGMCVSNSAADKVTVAAGMSPSSFSYDTIVLRGDGITDMGLVQGDVVLYVADDGDENGKMVSVSSLVVSQLSPDYNGFKRGGYSIKTWLDVYEEVFLLDELSVPTNFPQSDAGEYCVEAIDGFWRYSRHPLRIVSVEEDRLYLCTIDEKEAFCVVRGLPAGFYSVGDHVTFDVKEYYKSNDRKFTFVDADAISNLKVLDKEEIETSYLNYFAPVAEKPVIYLYPEQDTECSVRLEFDGKITCTYPEHGESGWQNFIASPDGTLTFPDGKQYYCLYWEGMPDRSIEITEGTCVKGSETRAFLERSLAAMGLSAREANEFIIYWLPQLEANDYNLISFIGEEYTDMARLEITPTPDSVLRVFMIAQPLDHYVKTEKQTFVPFEREGFTVIEWGGTIIK